MHVSAHVCVWVGACRSGVGREGRGGGRLSSLLLPPPFFPCCSRVCVQCEVENRQRGTVNRADAHARAHAQKRADSGVELYIDRKHMKRKREHKVEVHSDTHAHRPAPTHGADEGGGGGGGGSPGPEGGEGGKGRCGRCALMTTYHHRSHLRRHRWHRCPAPRRPCPLRCSCATFLRQV